MAINRNAELAERGRINLAAWEDAGNEAAGKAAYAALRADRTLIIAQGAEGGGGVGTGVVSRELSLPDEPRRDVWMRQ